MPKALEQITILDLTQFEAGTSSTETLAFLGANVIKIEEPRRGDQGRAVGGEGGGDRIYFAVLNANKRSVTCNLKHEKGRALLRDLIEQADVFIENFGYGVTDRLGIGYDDLRERNPGIIYASITGYGETGPRAHEAGHDLNYQAVSGLLSLSPTMPAALVADIAGGAMPAVMNILLALRQRDLTGEGAYLDIAMADAMFTFAWFGLAEGHARGRMPGAGDNMLTGGSPRYGLYPTADGQVLAVGALEQKFWDAFCEGIGLPADLRDDRRDPEGTRAAVSRIVASRDGAAWRAILEPFDCCCTLVASLEEAVADEHFQGRGLLSYRAEGCEGATIPLTALPIAPEFRAGPEVPRRVATVGEHSNAVLGTGNR